MGKDLKGKEIGKGISQRSDGRYIGRYTDRFGKRKTIYNLKLNDLRRELREAIYEDEHGLNGNGESLTVDEWYYAWIDKYKKNIIKESTISSHNIYYNSRIKPEFGDMYLKDVNLDQVQDWVNGMLEDGLASSTVEGYVVLVRDMFNQAKYCKYIKDNPCDGVVFPKRAKKESRFLTQEEQDTFFSVAASFKYINVLKFTLTTGCRIGEVLGLKWSDCNFENRTISINKTLHYSKRLGHDKCEFFYTTAKTDNGMRVIPMTDEIYQILRAEKVRQLTLIARYKQWNPTEDFEGLVFTRRNGMPIYYRDINNKIKFYVKYINDVEEALAKEEGREPVEFKMFTCHSLRHTYSTRCYEYGMDNLVLQKIMGHTDFNMTAKKYIHATDEIKRKEAEKFQILT